MRFNGIPVRDSDGDEDGIEEGRFFLILVEPQGARGSRGDHYVLRKKPGRTNSSGEELLSGWLGETNNVNRTAEGAVEIYRDSSGRLRGRRIDAQELLDEDEAMVGRPPRSEDGPASARMEIRVTPGEKARLEQLAGEAGLSISDYVRKRCL